MIESVNTHVLMVSEGKNISQIIIYKYESVTVKVRLVLMNDGVGSIWLEFRFKQHKKLLVRGQYTVWQHMGKGPNRFLLSQEATLQEKETVVLGSAAALRTRCPAPYRRPSGARPSRSWQSYLINKSVQLPQNIIRSTTEYHTQLTSSNITVTTIHQTRQSRIQQKSYEMK